MEGYALLDSLMDGEDGGEFRVTLQQAVCAETCRPFD